MKNKDNIERKGSSIRIRLFIIIVVTFTLFMVPFLWYVGVVLKNNILTTKLDAVKIQSHESVKNISERLLKYIQIAKDVGAYVDFDQLKEGSYVHQRILEEKKFNNFKDFYYVSASGRATIFNKKLLVMDFGANHPLVVEALSGKSLIYGPNRTHDDDGKLTDELVVSIKTVLKKNGKKLGYSAIDFSGDKLATFVDNTNVLDGGYAFIVKSSMEIIAHPNSELVANGVTMEKMSEEDSGYLPLIEAMKTLEQDSAVSGRLDLKDGEFYYNIERVPMTEWIQCLIFPTSVMKAQIIGKIFRLLLFTIVMLILLGIVFYFTTGKLIEPVRRIVNTLKDISEGDGDLTVRLPVKGNDELAHMSGYFNKTMSKIALTIKSVANDANEMHNIGEELVTNMNETASSINQISANISGVKEQVLTQSSGVTETAATMEEIIRTIKQLDTSITNQASSVSESSSSIEEMIANIASIGNMLNETDEAMKTLHEQTLLGKEGATHANSDVSKIAEQSDALLEASSIIQNIASQTNLLAMNAAIEAAHAGDSGKGFAVVADEIRKLAEESNVQGRQIAATIKASTEIISDLIISGSGAEDVFQKVVGLAANVLSRLDNIVEAMGEQDRGSKEVLSAMRDINIITHEVKDGSEEMFKGSQEVATEMQKLDELTRIITNSMNEMANGAIQINNAIYEVNSMTMRNKESIDNLHAEVKQFKV